eukprot:TRINITY_DN2173_c0_g1_i1.p1 TRINITY_DN2173_c0_g1~~TRINITY_DN2173_c0_g1_i1.p1  ORF type:complete len:1856 (+),score=427.07 TRINITY_DN2173_c0_g1_i1:29-5569(+)
MDVFTSDKSPLGPTPAPQSPPPPPTVHKVSGTIASMGARQMENLEERTSSQNIIELRLQQQTFLKFFEDLHCELNECDDPQLRLSLLVCNAISLPDGDTSIISAEEEANKYSSLLACVRALVRTCNQRMACASPITSPASGRETDASDLLRLLPVMSKPAITEEWYHERERLLQALDSHTLASQDAKQQVEKLRERESQLLAEQQRLADLLQEKQDLIKSLQDQLGDDDSDDDSIFGMKSPVSQRRQEKRQQRALQEQLCAERENYQHRLQAQQQRFLRLEQKEAALQQKVINLEAQLAEQAIQLRSDRRRRTPDTLLGLGETLLESSVQSALREGGYDDSWLSASSKGTGTARLSAFSTAQQQQVQRLRQEITALTQRNERDRQIAESTERTLRETIEARDSEALTRAEQISRLEVSLREARAAMQRQLNSAEDQVRTLEAVLREKETVIKQQEDKYEEYRERTNREIQRLNKTHMHLQQRWKLQTEDVASQEQERDELCYRLQQRNEQLEADLKEQQGQLRDRELEYQRRLQQLDRLVDDKTLQLSAKETRFMQELSNESHLLQRLQEENQTLKRSEAAAVARAQSCENRVRQAEDEVIAAREEISSEKELARTREENLQGKLSRIQAQSKAQLLKLEEDLRRREQQLADLGSRMEAKEQEWAAEQAQHAKIRIEKERQLGELCREAASLQASLARERDSLRQVENRAAESERDLHCLTLRAEEAEARCEEHEHHLEELRREHQRMRNESEQAETLLRDELAAVRQQNHELQKHGEAALAKARLFESKYSAIEAEVNELRQRTDTQSASHRRWHDERQALLTKVEGLQRSAEDLRELNRTLEGELRDVRSDLLGKQKQIDLQRQSAEEAKRQLAEQRLVEGVLRAEVDAVRLEADRRIADALSRVDESRSGVGLAEKRCEDAIRRAQELERQMEEVTQQAKQIRNAAKSAEAQHRAERSNQNKAYQRLVNEVQATQTLLEEQHKDFDAKEQKLLNQIEALRAAKMATSKEFEDRAAQLLQAEDRTCALRAEIKTVLQETEALRQQLQKMEKERAAEATDFRRRDEESRHEIQTLRCLLDDKQGSLSEADGTVASQRQQLALCEQELAREREARRQSEMEWQERVQRLEQMLRESGQQCGVLSEEQRRLEDRFREVSQREASLRENARRAEQVASEQTAELENLTSCLRDAQQRLENERQSRQEIERQLHLAKDERDSAELHLENERTSGEQLHRSLKEAKLHSETMEAQLRAILREKEDTLRTLQVQSEAEKRRYDQEKDKEIKLSLRHVEEYKRKLTDAEAAHSRERKRAEEEHKHQLQTLEEKLNLLEVQLGSLRNKEQDTVIANKMLSSQLEERDARLRSTQAELDTLQQLSSLQAAKAETELQRLRTKLDRQQGAMWELEAASCRLEQERKNMEARCKDLEQTVGNHQSEIARLNASLVVASDSDAELLEAEERYRAELERQSAAYQKELQRVQTQAFQEIKAVQEAKDAHMQQLQRELTLLKNEVLGQKSFQQRSGLQNHSQFDSSMAAGRSPSGPTSPRRKVASPKANDMLVQGVMEEARKLATEKEGLCAALRSVSQILETALGSPLAGWNGERFDTPESVKAFSSAVSIALTQLLSDSKRSSTPVARRSPSPSPVAQPGAWRQPLTPATHSSANARPQNLSAVADGTMRLLTSVRSALRGACELSTKSTFVTDNKMRRLCNDLREAKAHAKYVLSTCCEQTPKVTHALRSPTHDESVCSSNFSVHSIGCVSSVVRDAIEDDQSSVSSSLISALPTNMLNKPKRAQRRRSQPDAPRPGNAQFSPPRRQSVSASLQRAAAAKWTNVEAAGFRALTMPR